MLSASEALSALRILKRNPLREALNVSGQWQSGARRLSFVVIGLNEAANLGDCIESIRKMAPVPGVSVECIYADGGSEDESVQIAEAAEVDHIVRSPVRRKAAENRNAGLKVAEGEFIQFLDGDMTLDPEWPAAAVAFLEAHPDVAAVCGRLQEKNQSLLYRALEVDWGVVREGPIRLCGGAALWRRKVLEEAGGFPVDVRYGEEPLLCWRVRNKLGFKIYQLDRRMVVHDLGYVSVWDYWKRTVRAGETYAEIASRLKRTADPLWLKESRANYAWCAAILLGAAAVCFAPMPIKLGVLILAVGVVLRKWIFAIRNGLKPLVALIFALHTYSCKLPLAFGQVRWRWRYAQGDRLE